jgi:hypothetical protein
VIWQGRLISGAVFRDDGSNPSPNHSADAYNIFKKILYNSKAGMSFNRQRLSHNNGAAFH